jgi:serine/threonine protein phosphatase PrpC
VGGWRRAAAAGRLASAGRRGAGGRGRALRAGGEGGVSSVQRGAAPRRGGAHSSLPPARHPRPAAPRPSAAPADADTHIVIASDGLFAEEARGGGGGLDNATVAELCGASSGTSCKALAETMSTAAQKVGSTDDVTVVVLRLK